VRIIGEQGSLTPDPEMREPSSNAAHFGLTPGT
jgi:hypothetical protein